MLMVTLGLVSCGSERDTQTNPSFNEVTLSEEGSTKNGEVQFIDSKEAKNLIQEQDSLIILDVRTQDEYNKGHLQDALLIDFNSADFSKHLQVLDPGKFYLVYCAVGGRSSKAAVLMQKMGFKKVFGVSEGYSELKEAGIPVSTPSS